MLQLHPPLSIVGCFCFTRLMQMHRLIITAQREARSFASTRWLWGLGERAVQMLGKRLEIEGQEQRTASLETFASV